MHVGMAAVFQNPGKARTDREVYRNELRLGRPRRAARLRVDLGRRAPLHRLHDVPRRAAVPDVLRRPHASASSSARWWWCCRGTTRCASPSRWRCSTTCRTAGSSSASGAALGASSSTASVVDGRVAPALRRVGGDDPARARDGLLRVRRQASSSSPRRDPARARSSRSAAAPTRRRSRPSRCRSWRSSASAS